MSRESVLKLKSFRFAIRIVKFCNYLKLEKHEFVIARQILKSGTAIGAIIREAEQGESRNDFVHKLSMSLKEANETIYWLELLYYTGYIDKKIFESLNNDCLELLKMLISSIKTLKSGDKPQ